MAKISVLWVLKTLNLIAFLATVGVNALANALPINGKTTGELSDLYPNLFVPAGMTFSIWGLIYLLLAIFAVYQIATPNRNAAGFLERIGPLFIVASAANIGIGLHADSWREKLLVHLPFSIYLGWITVATIANLTAVLVHIGWNRFGASEELWTVVVLVVAALITLAVLFTRNDLFYALVILWAFLGILLKRLAVDSPPSRAILITLWIAMAVVGLGLLLRIPRWLRT